MDESQRGFDFLRVSLETRLTGPSIIAVTSARDDDGAGTVATGLAEAFAEAGRSTLLIARPALHPGVNRAKLSRMALPQLLERAGGERSELARTIASLRESHGVVVIEAEPLPSSTIAYEFAREADGVIVAIRFGRRAGQGDLATRTLLEDAGANVLGIVPTGARGRGGAFRRGAAALSDDYRPRTRALEASG